MKIIELQIEGFRSFRSQTWRPGDLNVLIGPNAGGKSNLLKALELLQHAAAGDLDEHILREGGMGAVVYDGKAECIRLSVESPFQENEDQSVSTTRVSYGINVRRIGNSPNFRIDDEMLRESPIVASQSDSSLPRPRQLIRGELGVTLNSVAECNKSDELLNWIILSSRGGRATEALLSSSRFDDDVFPSVRAFHHYMADWSVASILRTDRDAAVRTASIASFASRVASDGSNFIAVLHTHYESNGQFREEIDDSMRAAFGDAYRGLSFPPAAEQRVQLGIRWAGLFKTISSADLSDGTLRFLYLLTILCNPVPPPLIAIDEPETGLHPSMLGILAEVAREASRRTQVIFTTHSPEFLDTFEGEPPTTTVVELVDGESKLRTLDGDELSDWLKRFTLGELFRTRELELLP